MQIKIEFYYVISISFEFDSIFTFFFNEHDRNFDHVSKIAFPGFLKITIF